VNLVETGEKMRKRQQKRRKIEQKSIKMSRNLAGRKSAGHKKIGVGLSEWNDQQVVCGENKPKLAPNNCCRRC
jgi:hypothetical protein